MMRSVFLYLSASNTARRILLRMPFSKRLAARFIAGESLAQAINVTHQLNAKGLTVCLDLLGESVNSEAEAKAITDSYLALLTGIASEKVQAYASVKLTALGLDISEPLCIDHLRQLLACARDLQRFVRIDMEGSAYTERTLRVFRVLHAEFDNLGIVIQSYLRRSEADMRELAREGANVRLVKGAYKEPENIAFPQKADVDASFIRLIELFLSDEARTAGARLAIATHDDAMIAAACRYADAHHIARTDFEFQMLYGVRGARLEALVKEGYHARVYVPYGTTWYPYFMRRLAERPANVWFIAKNFFRG